MKSVIVVSWVPCWHGLLRDRAICGRPGGGGEHEAFLSLPPLPPCLSPLPLSPSLPPVYARICFRWARLNCRWRTRCGRRGKGSQANCRQGWGQEETDWGGGRGEEGKVQRRMGAEASCEGVGPLVKLSRALLWIVVSNCICDLSLFRFSSPTRFCLLLLQSTHFHFSSPTGFRLLVLQSTLCHFSSPTGLCLLVLQSGVWRSIAHTPWIIKPLYGFITDTFPIGGQRRRPYMLACGITGRSLALFLITRPPDPAAPNVIFPRGVEGTMCTCMQSYLCMLPCARAIINIPSFLPSCARLFSTCLDLIGVSLSPSFKCNNHSDVGLDAMLKRPPTVSQGHTP